MESTEALRGYDVVHQRPKTSFAGVPDALRDLGVVGEERMAISAEGFAEYQKRAAYQDTYPNYWKQFGRPGVWERKQLEHYISIEVLQPKPGGLYIDVAAAGSPVADVIRRHYAARAYGQDIRWTPGIDEAQHRIGSNASNIPLPAASVDGIVTHNAIEHFEQHFDRDFMVECARLLKPGGMVCIIPFVPNLIGYNVTSPDYWQVKFGADAADPVFDERLSVVVDNGARQRLLKIHSPQTLSEDCRIAGALSWTLVHITNAAEFGFQRAMLVGRKP